MLVYYLFEILIYVYFYKYFIEMDILVFSKISFDEYNI